MLILGIDPGPETHGAVLYDSAARRVVWCDAKAGFSCLRKASEACFPVADGREADIIACEWIEPAGQRMYSQVVETIRAEASIRDSLDWHPGWRTISRKQVKIALLGTPKGGDTDVRAALIARHGSSPKEARGTKANPGPLYGVSSHAWAALAVAVVAAEMEVGSAKRG